MIFDKEKPMEDMDIREKATESAQEKFGATLCFLSDLEYSAKIARDAIVEAEYLRLDRDYWKQQYMESLNHSIRHTEAMSGLMLKAALDGAFTPKAGK